MGRKKTPLEILNDFMAPMYGHKTTSEKKVFTEEPFDIDRIYSENEYEYRQKKAMREALRLGIQIVLP